MEEKKSTMGVVKNDAPQQEQRLTYEQLNEACGQLFQQNQQLRRQLQESNLTGIFKRLDYLFKVLDHAEIICDPEFVGSCTEEIKDILTIREEPKEAEKEA